MKIVVGADHGGWELKELVKKSLETVGVDFEDVGCFSKDSVDYPDYAENAVSQIVTNQCQMGILICGTGIGMAIAANRHRKIRAANCCTVDAARLSREHNNANVLCLGARVLEVDMALEMVHVWLNTPFSGGRHQRRIDKLSD